MSVNATSIFPARRADPVVAAIALAVGQMCAGPCQAAAASIAEPPTQTLPSKDSPNKDLPNKDSPSDGARPQDPVSTDAELNDASVGRKLDAMRARQNASKALNPTKKTSQPSVPPAAGQASEPIPGMAASDFGVPGSKRLREGAFISRRPGTMLHAPTGDWIFVPSPLTSAAPEAPPSVDRPMVVLASQTLERLENAIGTAEGGQERPSAILSGQIFSYRGREYLLLQPPSSLVTTGRGEAAGNAAPPAPRGQEESRPQADLSQPSVQGLIRDLESRRNSPRALAPMLPDAKPARAEPATPSNIEAAKPVQRAPLPANSHGDERSGTLAPEGSIVTSRRGRVIRLAGGELAFTVDGDAQGNAERPMILLPSQTLQRLEDLVLWRGERQVVEISGRVTTYSGHNYLMPTMFVVPPPSELGPMQ